MATFDEIIRLSRVTEVELTGWIDQRWVRPRRTESGLEFDEVDRARIELIRELHRDLMLDDEAMGVVLSLLDQLYAARQMLRAVEEAVETLPESVRDEIRARLRRPPD